MKHGTYDDVPLIVTRDEQVCVPVEFFDAAQALNDALDAKLRKVEEQRKDRETTAVLVSFLGWMPAAGLVVGWLVRR
jgi:hypothetical protein